MLYHNICANETCRVYFVTTKKNVKYHSEECRKEAAWRRFKRQNNTHIKKRGFKKAIDTPCGERLGLLRAFKREKNLQ